MNECPAEGSNKTHSVETAMKKIQLFLSLALMTGIPALSNTVQADQLQAGAKAPQAFPGTKHSLAPLPVEIYNQPGQKPTVAFSTPCIQIEKMTNGFPPILAFETFMFTVIGNVNESNVLPLRLEPVCI